jgi:hypothetical protein
MLRERTRRRGRWQPIPAVLTGCYLLATAGCGYGTSLTGPDDHNHVDVDPSLFEPGDPNRVRVKSARLRSTPGGCEVDVTFTNVSDKSLSAGFRYDIVDAAGGRVARRDTAVQQAAPGTTQTVSSEGTTAGPSGVPCPRGGRANLVGVSVFNV